MSGRALMLRHEFHLSQNNTVKRTHVAAGQLLATAVRKKRSRYKFPRRLSRGCVVLARCFASLETICSGGSTTLCHLRLNFNSDPDIPDGSQHIFFSKGQKNEVQLTLRVLKEVSCRDGRRSPSLIPPGQWSRPNDFLMPTPRYSDSNQ